MDLRGAIELSRHARWRMQSRGISSDALEACLRYGREVHCGGASLLVIGRKEVQRERLRQVDLQAHEGIHVVISEGTIITIYRNRRRLAIPRRRHPQLRQSSLSNHICDETELDRAA